MKFNHLKHEEENGTYEIVDQDNRAYYIVGKTKDGRGQKLVGVISLLTGHILWIAKSFQV